MYGRYEGLHHRYLIEGSLDGENWDILVDRKESYRDTPNDYVELALPKSARYIRYKNIDIPTPNLAISELRVFGLGTVYDKTDLLMKTLTADQDYYFCVEAFNENGVSLRSEVKHVK